MQQPLILAALVSSSITGIMLLVASIIQNWMYKNRDQYIKIVEEKRRIYASFLSKLQMLSNLFLEYQSTYAAEHKRIISPTQRVNDESKVGKILIPNPAVSVWKTLADTEQLLGECSLFAGPELSKKLTEVEDIVYSVVLREDWKAYDDYDKKSAEFWDAMPTPELATEACHKLKELREIILRLMRLELRIP